MASAWNGFRQALYCCRSRIATALTVGTLIAISVGFSAAVLSVAQHILLEPLPYSEADSLVLIWERYDTTSMLRNVRIPTYQALEKRSKSLDGACIVEADPSVLTGLGSTESVNVGRVCSNFFRLFRVDLLLGRHFEKAEQFIGHANVVIISEDFWQTRLNNRNDVLGSTIHLNGLPLTVIGVVPASFHYPSYPNPMRGSDLTDCDFWRPIVLDGPSFEAQLSNANHQLIARLHPTSRVSDLEAELDLIEAQLASSYPQHYSDTTLISTDLTSAVQQPYESAVLAFLCALLVFLLIASLNVSTLLVVQAVSRHTEILIRLSLSAPRISLVVQLLFEFIMVISFGSVLGLVVASLLLSGLRWLAPENLLLLHSVFLDGWSAVLAILVTIALCNGFAIVPCIRAIRNVSKGGLSAGSRATGGLGNNMVTRVLTAISVAQIAMSVAALLGATLMMTGFIRLVNDEAGFSLDRVLTLRLATVRVGFPAEQRLQFFTESVRVIQELPFVESVGITTRLPLDGSPFISATNKRGGLATEDLFAEWRWVRGRYFDAMGIPVEDGRVFRSTDYGSGLKLAVISKGLARALWPRENPIGRSLRRVSENSYYTVIGVVGDVRNESMGKAPAPQAYGLDDDMVFPEMSMALRTSSEPFGLARSVRESIEGVNRGVAISDIRTMKDILHDSVASERFSVFIGIIVAVACVILALFGVAGLVAYRIEQQSYSIGIQLALGATQMDIVMKYARQTLNILVAGLVSGLSLAFLLIGIISPLLYKTRFWDPMALAGVSVLIVATGLAVCVMVSLRKSTLDPQRLISL